MKLLRTGVVGKFNIPDNKATASTANTVTTNNVVGHRKWGGRIMHWWKHYRHFY